MPYGVRGSSAKSLGSSGSTRLAISRNPGRTSFVGTRAKRGSVRNMFTNSANVLEKPACLMTSSIAARIRATSRPPIS